MHTACSVTQHLTSKCYYSKHRDIHNFVMVRQKESPSRKECNTTRGRKFLRTKPTVHTHTCSKKFCLYLGNVIPSAKENKKPKQKEFNRQK